MAAVAGITVLFDPFYVYHKPLPGLKAVLNDKEYQCVGSLKHFDYDTLIVGSSVCENYNNHWFDEGFDCTSIKAIRSYGATADLMYLVDIAYENQDIKKVFYNIDPSSLYAPLETTYVSTGCPVYLYDDNPFNDYQYLFNKDVLLEKIPFMLAKSFSDHDEGESYNWAQWKTFHHLMCMQMYERPEKISPMQDPHMYDELAVQNTALLTAMVEAHPETEFYFFFSPYSMCWWDAAYRNGERDAVLNAERICLDALTGYDNVRIFFYQDDTEIITNLDNYMDAIHFSAEVNHYVYESIQKGRDEITPLNKDEVMDGMYDLSEEIVDRYIHIYYE